MERMNKTLNLKGNFMNKTVNITDLISPRYDETKGTNRLAK